MTRFCPSCHKTILHGSLTAQIMSDDYHSSCIHCFRCGQNLWQKGFVKRSDGKLACEEGMCPVASVNTEVIPIVPAVVPVVETRKVNHHANSFSINNQFQDEVKQPNQKTMTTVPQATQSVPQTTIIGTLLPNPKYSKYFKDTTDKESVKNGKTNNAVHSYNMGKNINGNNKNQNTIVVESMPHQIDTFPVQTESLVYGKQDDSRRTSISTKTPEPDTCPKCNLIVKENERVMYNQRAFHKQCLNCDSCKAALFKMKKIQYDTATGNHYCEPCYAELFGPKCGKCNKPVTSYQLSSTFADKIYHKECFVCGRCKLSLANREFTKIGNLVICKSCL